METIKFRYTESIDVIVSSNFSSRSIIFKENDKSILRVLFRQGYFYAIEFGHDIFGNHDCGLNYIRMTAKDGSAFLGRVYVNGFFYAIRKKKNKPQIIFAKSKGIKYFQLGKDVFGAVCYYEGNISNDEQLINDFFSKRQTVEFDEQKYIDSLNPEDKKYYLNDKKIAEIIEQIGKKNSIEKERVEDLIFYVQCMSKENETKNKVLNSNDIDEIASLVLPLTIKAKEYFEKNDSALFGHDAFQNREYTFDKKFVYSKNNLDSVKLNLKENEQFVNNLFWFFEDEYEQVKEYLNNGIEKTKNKIDEVLPFFKEYIEKHK